MRVLVGDSANSQEVLEVAGPGASASESGHMKRPASSRLRVSTASRTRASTGNPKENPTPRSRHAWANL